MMDFEPTHKYHVLTEEVDHLSSVSKSSFLDVAIRLLSRHITLFLKIPSYAYLRAKVLCEDITELEEERFTVDDLLMLIYESFLVRLREAHTHQDLYTIYRSIITSDYKDASVHSYRTLKDKHQPSYEMKFKITVPRNKVLRCEVFLYDLAQYVPNHMLSIERVIEILFTDFIIQYCAGSNPGLIEDLLETLGE